MLELACKCLKTVIVSMFKHYKHKDGHNEWTDKGNHCRKIKTMKNSQSKILEQKLLLISKWKLHWMSLTAYWKLLNRTLVSLKIGPYRTERRTKRLKTWTKLQWPVEQYQVTLHIGNQNLGCRREIKREKNFEYGMAKNFLNLMKISTYIFKNLYKPQRG